MRRSRFVAPIAAVGLVLAGGSLALGMSTAAAEPSSSSTSPESDSLVTAKPMPTWQTNGVVYAVETVGDVTYVGGNFTAVRPPGAAAGVNQVARKNIAAFDAVTGDLLPFQHAFWSRNNAIPANGVYDKTCSPGTASGTYTCDTVYEIRANSDGSRIYIGGDFEKVDNLWRTGAAAFTTGNGALTSFEVLRPNGRIRALAVTDSAVYLGGTFRAIDGQPRVRTAAVNPTTGALLPFTATVDGQVIALATSAGGERVLIAGDFDNVNGVRHRGIMAVDPTTGANAPWSSSPLPGTAGGNRSYGTDIAVDSDSIYVASNGEGNFDGRLRIDPLTGNVLWTDTCLGATWAVERAGDLLFSGSHAHNCTDTAGGFPEAANGINDLADQHWHRLLAQTARGGTTAIEQWYPTTNGGIVGKLGPRDLSWAPQGVLWVAGEFTTVNSKPQQGLTRFGVPALAESQAPSRPATPLVVSVEPGTATVSWEPAEDLDNENLTYEVFRGSTLVHTQTAPSRWAWFHPGQVFTDTGLTPGAQLSYQIRAVDPSGVRSVKSWPANVTVATTTDAYRARVLADGATVYWPLDDQAERFAGGLGMGSSARYTSTGVTLGVGGALTGVPNRAVSLDGASSMVRGQSKEPMPASFSTEIWFKGSGGGKLVGFGNANVTTSSQVARTVYVDRNGRVVWGVTSGSRRTVTSSRAYTDNAWHHVVATVGPTYGMRLYVDGDLVGSNSTVRSGSTYDGYWHLGGDSLSGWTSAPTNSRFAGSLDEFAVYPGELSPETVAEHRTLGRG